MADEKFKKFRKSLVEVLDNERDSKLRYRGQDEKLHYIPTSTDPRAEIGDGAAVGVKRSGSTSERPSSADIYTGFQYFDTTLGLPVIYDGTSWVVLPKYEVVSELPASPDSNTLYLIVTS